MSNRLNNDGVESLTIPYNVIYRILILELYAFFFLLSGIIYQYFRGWIGISQVLVCQSVTMYRGGSIRIDVNLNVFFLVSAKLFNCFALWSCVLCYLSFILIVSLYRGGV